jgi:16S rRNA G1207 methylase RsmC
MALESTEASVWGVDINERALEVATENAGNLGLSNLTCAHPDQVPPELRWDVIWSNPPIRVGKKELHALLTRWLPRLSPEGEAWLVVAKKLGSDSLQDWISEGGAGDFVASRHETSRGFRVIRVARRSS